MLHERNDSSGGHRAHRAAGQLLSADGQELDRRGRRGHSDDDLFQTRLKFDVAISVRNCCEAVEILHRGSGASTIHEANPTQRYARGASVATVRAHFNYETCAQNYSRALAGKLLFGHFSALGKRRLEPAAPCREEHPPASL